MSDQKPKLEVEVIKSSQRWRIKPHTNGAESLNYSYEALSHHMSDKMMFPYLVTIPPSHGKSIEPSSHDGEEFIYILSGSIKANIDKESYHLKKGDTVYFDPAINHNFINEGYTDAQVLVCLINKKNNSMPLNAFERAYGDLK